MGIFDRISRKRVVKEKKRQEEAEAIASEINELVADSQEWERVVKVVTSEYNEEHLLSLIMKAVLCSLGNCVFSKSAIPRTALTKGDVNLGFFSGTTRLTEEDARSLNISEKGKFIQITTSIIPMFRMEKITAFVNPEAKTIEFIGGMEEIQKRFRLSDNNLCVVMRCVGAFFGCELKKSREFLTYIKRGCQQNS